MLIRYSKVKPITTPYHNGMLDAERKSGPGFFPGPVICEAQFSDYRKSSQQLRYPTVITPLTHTADHSMSLEHLLKIIAAILTATVRVKYETRSRSAAPDSHTKGIHNQFLCDSIVH